MLLNNGHQLEGQYHVLVDAVGHELKHPIRRHKCNRAVFIEAAQTHALVELDILDIDSAVGLGGSPEQHELVIDSKFALRPPAQLSFHHDLAHYFLAEDSAPLREENIHAFDHINVDFVLLIIDIGSSP